MLIKNPGIQFLKYEGKGYINKLRQIRCFCVQNQDKGESIFFFLMRKLSKGCFFLGNTTLLNNGNYVRELGNGR